MESIQLFLNDRLVSIAAKSSLIQQLKTDDSYLSEYITNAVKSNQFTFLNESDLSKLTVKRAIFTKADSSDLPPLTTISNNKTTTTTTTTAAATTTTTTLTATTTNLETTRPSSSDLIPVWCRKGKPSDDDLNATSLLLQLRANEKYMVRFNDKKSVRLKLWEEIANEIRDAGYDVDATKCQQKFLNMTKTHVKFLKRQMANSTTTTTNYNTNNQELKPPEFFVQMNEILQDKLNNSLLLVDHDDNSINAATTTTTTSFTTNIDSGDGGDDDDDDDDGGGDDNNNDESYHVRKKRKLCDLSDRFLTDRQFERLYRLYEERTKLMRERNQQNSKLLNLFERLINKFD